MFMSKTEYVMSVCPGCFLEVIPPVDNFNALSQCSLNKRNMKNRLEIVCKGRNFIFLRLLNPKAIFTICPNSVLSLYPHSQAYFFWKP